MLSGEGSSKLSEVRRILCSTHRALIPCGVVWNLSLNVNSQSTILGFLDTRGHEQGFSALAGLYIQKCCSMGENNVLCSFLFLMRLFLKWKSSLGSVFYWCSFSSPMPRFVGWICKQGQLSWKQSGDSEEVVLFLMKKVWGRECVAKMDVWCDPYGNPLCFEALHWNRALFVEGRSIDWAKEMSGQEEINGSL